MRVTIDQIFKKPEDVEQLEYLNLSTGICPIIHVGTYNTILGDPCDGDDMTSWAESKDYPPSLVYEDSFDFKKWKEYIQREANDILQSDILQALKPYGIEWLEATGMWSPKYYNTSNDELDFNVYLSKDFDRIFHENMEKFSKNPSLQKYIEDHYWSRSGFCSFMPQSFSEIEDFDDQERCLSAYLMFCMLTEGKEEDMDGEFDYTYRIWEELHSSAEAEECYDWCLYGDEALVELYMKHPIEFDNLLWDVFYKVGNKWNRHNLKEPWTGVSPKNEAERFICWAYDMKYSLEDLRELCA